MTIRDLKAKLSSMDDNYIVTMQRPDGTEMDINKAGQQGDHFTFFMDR